MKLKTAIEYIFMIDSRAGNGGHYDSIVRYANFLKQLLRLWMFIPCDKEGKPLEKPKFIDIESVDYQNYTSEVKEKYQEEYYLAEKEYQQACDSCLFTGFELHEDTMFNHTPCVIRKSDGVIINIENKTIEDVTKFNVELKKEICEKFKY